MMEKKHIGFGLGTGSIVALYFNDSELFMKYLNMAMQHQVSQYLLAFSIAAWIHSGRVKKEFHSLTMAINNLGSALRLDLSTLGNRIGDVERQVQGISSRVETLEKPKE